MARLNESFLQELRYRCDISDVVSKYVMLKRSGRQQKGLCPFHSEKTPSFMVYEDTQSFYCFGCGAGGDVITFIRRAENLDYMDAVRYLADLVGMEMPEDKGDKEAGNLRRRVMEINREAARYYYSCLISESGKTARDYFKKRRLSAETIKRFGLGFSPDSGFATVKHLKSKGYRDEELLLAGFKKGRNGGIYDPFFGRAIFPIIDIRGNVIAFGGRKINEEANGPKYLNSSDTLVFKKSLGLFAMNIAKNKGDGRIILAEGYMDVIAMHQAGFEYAVATLGTALTDDQARMISRYAKEVIIAYDADAAGQKATIRAIDIFKKLDIDVRVLTIPDAKDPDEYIKTYGTDKFALLLNQSGNQVEYRITKLAGNFDLKTSDGRLNFLKEFTLLLADIPSLVEREIYADKVAADLGINKSALLEDAERAAKNRKYRTEKKNMSQMATDISAFNDKINPEKRKYLRGASAEEALISALISAPEYREEVEKRISPEEFITAFNKKLYKKVLEAIEKYGIFDLGMLSDEFSPEEMGRISLFSITARSRKTADMSEIEQYAEVIKKEKAMADSADIKDMTNDDFMQMLNNIGKGKK